MLMFMCSVEVGWDFADIEIDGSVVLSEYDEDDWEEFEFALDNNNLVSFIYIKDYVISSGDDTCYVDNIRF